MLIRFSLVLAGDDVGVVGNHQDTLLESDAVIREHFVDDFIASQDPFLSYVATVNGDAYLIAGFFSMEGQIADLASYNAFLIRIP